MTRPALPPKDVDSKLRGVVIHAIAVLKRTPSLLCSGSSRPWRPLAGRRILIVGFRQVSDDAPAYGSASLGISPADRGDRVQARRWPHAIRVDWPRFWALITTRLLKRPCCCAVKTAAASTVLRTAAS